MGCDLDSLELITKSWQPVEPEAEAVDSQRLRSWFSV